VSGLRVTFGQGQAGVIETVALDTLMVRLFEQIDEANVGWLLALVARLRAQFGPHALDLVPSYTTVMVHFNVLELSPAEARERVLCALDGLTPVDISHGREHRVPVWYDVSVGPDLPRLAQLSGLAPAEVVRRHCAKAYRVFALYPRLCLYGPGRTGPGRASADHSPAAGGGRQRGYRRAANGDLPKHFPRRLEPFGANAAGAVQPRAEPVQPGRQRAFRGDRA
jgi:hypothetical protein